MKLDIPKLISSMEKKDWERRLEYFYLEREKILPHQRVGINTDDWKEFIQQELDKAREEVQFTKEESKILRWSVENSEEAICTIWDKDILEVIQSKLSKLKQ